jgi:hypothetical protein
MVCVAVRKRLVDGGRKHEVLQHLHVLGIDARGLIRWILLLAAIDGNGDHAARRCSRSELALGEFRLRALNVLAAACAVRAA